MCLKFFRVFFLLLVFISTACSKLTSPTKSRILLIIEERKFPEDQIIEKRFYEDALLNRSVLHDSNDKSGKNLFSSEFKTLTGSEFKKFKKNLEIIKASEHHNEFPWQEDFYKKGNIIKVQFPKAKKLEFLSTTSNGKTLENEILLLESRFYYAGKDFPEALKEILAF
jgi:hypothetical protein